MNAIGQDGFIVGENRGYANIVGLIEFKQCLFNDYDWT
jgi:hypothetical protein